MVPNDDDDNNGAADVKFSLHLMWLYFFKI